jgi:hypothetical protein
MLNEYSYVKAQAAKMNVEPTSDVDNSERIKAIQSENAK